MKLLATENVLSARLLSRILIQLHNPVLKSDTYLLQYIIKFLNYFAREVPQSQNLLRDSYFIALKLLENSQDSLVYQEIDQDKVSELILILTRSDGQKSGFSNAHNELVHKMLAELLDDDSELDKEVIIKALLKLQLKIESAETRQELVRKVDDVIAKVRKLLLCFCTNFDG